MAPDSRRSSDGRRRHHRSRRESGGGDEGGRRRHRRSSRERGGHDRAPTDVSYADTLGPTTRGAQIRAAPVAAARPAAPAVVVDPVAKAAALAEARRSEKVADFKAWLGTGVPVWKHTRSGARVARVLKAGDPVRVPKEKKEADKQALQLTAPPPPPPTHQACDTLACVPPDGAPRRSSFAPTQLLRPVSEILQLQSGDAPDPTNPGYGGTWNLRRSGGKSAIFVSVCIHYEDRTLDLECQNRPEYLRLVEGIELLREDARGE